MDVPSLIFYSTSLPCGEQAVKLAPHIPVRMSPPDCAPHIPVRMSPPDCAPHTLCPTARSKYLLPTVTFLLYT